jgi:fumarate reductase flavoprotein subunit
MSVPQDCDVVVVGGGGAGLTAALSAAERGLRVILLERRSKLGGSTALAIGSLTAAGTRWQRAKGIHDTPDDLLADMAAIPGVVAAADAPDLRAILAVEAAPALNWLSGIGVPFVGPFPEAPHRVPRMHNVVPDSRMYIRCLERAARKAGVHIVLSAAVDKLLEENGEVAGVSFETMGERHSVRAQRGVILTTGDFSGNAEMRRAFLKPAAAASVPANPESTGDGHRLAIDLGAAMQRMDVSTGPKLRFHSAPPRGLLARLPLSPMLMKPLAALVQILPPGALRPFVKSLLVAHMQPSPKLFDSGAILVNLMGARFCDETKSTLDLAHQRDAAGYIIFDQRIAQSFSRYPNFVSTAPGIGYAYMNDYQRARPDLVHRADSVEELAEKLNFNPSALLQSLQNSNHPIRLPLFALGPVLSTVTTTEGGVVVDQSMKVIRSDGTPIRGLFAAGAVAQGGMRLFGHGLHIGWAVVSGRIAGQTAAQSMPHSLRSTVWAVRND